jgi:hypothetical protein
MDYKYIDFLSMSKECLNILHQLAGMKTESLILHVKTFSYDNFKKQLTSKLLLHKKQRSEAQTGDQLQCCFQGYLHGILVVSW